MIEPRHRFVVLDGMRGIAAIAVMVSHTAPMAKEAILAVDLFFMLSGFVLAHGFGERLARPGERWRFVIGRFIRLEPLYLMGCLIALGPVIGMALADWWFYSGKVILLSVVTAPFFIPLPYDGGTLPLNPPGWSLAMELLANLVFIFTAARRLPALLIVSISGAALLYGVWRWDGSDGTGWATWGGAVARVMFSFFVGVLLYRLWKSGRLPRPNAPAVVLFALLLVLYFYEPAREREYVAIVLFLVHPLLIWIGACSIPKARVARFATWLGMISYGVYVLHAPILMWVESARYIIWDANQTYYERTGEAAPLVILLTIASAHWLTRRYETPVRRWLTKRLMYARVADSGA